MGSPRDSQGSAIHVFLVYIYICVDFIQDACTESLDGQVQGATTQPPYP